MGRGALPPVITGCLGLGPPVTRVQCWVEQSVRGAWGLPEGGSHDEQS